MRRNINDRGGGKLTGPGLRYKNPVRCVLTARAADGAIELYNCPDQEINDPESVRSRAFYKPLEIQHILEKMRRKKSLIIPVACEPK